MQITRGIHAQLFTWVSIAHHFHLLMENTTLKKQSSAIVSNRWVLSAGKLESTRIYLLVNLLYGTFAHTHSQFINRHVLLSWSQMGFINLN